MNWAIRLRWARAHLEGVAKLLVAITAIFAFYAASVRFAGGDIPPWITPAYAQQMKDATDGKLRDVTTILQSLQAGLKDEHTQNLLNQKSALISQMYEQKSHRDNLSAALTQSRIDWIDWQLKHPNEPVPPPP